MKPAIPLLAIVSLLVATAASEEGVADYWWMLEQPRPGVHRVVDMKHACKIIIAGDKTSFFRESGGKLEEYFTSSSGKFAAETRQLIDWAPSQYVTTGDGIFLRVKTATSVAFEESFCSLRVGTVEFGKLTDPGQIKKVWQILGYKEPLR